MKSFGRLLLVGFRLKEELEKIICLVGLMGEVLVILGYGFAFGLLDKHILSLNNLVKFKNVLSWTELGAVQSYLVLAFAQSYLIPVRNFISHLRKM